MSKTTIERYLSSPSIGATISGLPDESTYGESKIDTGTSSEKDCSLVEDSGPQDNQPFLAIEKGLSSSSQTIRSHIGLASDGEGSQSETLRRSQPEANKHSSSSLVSGISQNQNLFSYPPNSRRVQAGITQNNQEWSAPQSFENQLEVQVRDFETNYERLDFPVETPEDNQPLCENLTSEDMYDWNGDGSYSDPVQFDLFDDFFFGSN